MEQKILITGATGTIGHEAVKALLKKGADIKIGVRTLTKIQNKPWLDHVEIIPLDYNQPETLKNALVNTNKLFLVTPPGTYHEKKVINIILTQGKKQKLQHIVRLSGMGANQYNLFSNDYEADTLLLASDIHYTALQANTFMQNFYNHLTSIKAQQRIIEPAGDGKTSFIDGRDIAAVAATVLTESGHENKLYELTGGESLNYSQAAEIFSATLNQKITYQPLNDEQYIKVKGAEGTSAQLAERSIQFFQMVKNGEYARVSPLVEKILGRPPITLKQFVMDYRNQFI